ncbi:type II secretion system F family protein [Arthrobacter sp. AQ5-05]|uniref:type II secretion system F family protein n=1 Tax=Arthrobacter sp. AQ5-05 TaxID=2184581 RepID=UPI000DCB6C5A|nr:type II secretion system F family protein [Arthrobacter sp. AQ5-05]RAX50353.1 type II secretion system F family protein [Arthrobacter sp. AQ5-05]
MTPALVAVLLAGAAVWIFSGAGSLPRGPSRDRSPSALPQRKGMQAAAGADAGPHAGSGAEGPAEPLPLVLEMCATLLESGLPIRSVLRIIGTNVPGYASLLLVSRALDLNVGWERAWGQGAGPARELEQSLRLTRLSGAPAAALLRSAAASARKRGVREAEARGAEFGIKLVIPLGLCALPAFICLGVVPVVISLLPRF